MTPRIDGAQAPSHAPPTNSPPFLHLAPAQPEPSREALIAMLRDASMSALEARALLRLIALDRLHNALRLHWQTQRIPAVARMRRRAVLLAVRECRSARQAHRDADARMWAVHDLAPHLAECAA